MTTIDLNKFNKLCKHIDIQFADINILVKAFTHRSFLNENRNSGLEHNERLEFLGDAVLELVVTDFLYKKYPKKPEGEMTALRSALVNAVTLSKVAEEMGLNEFLLLSRGEAKDEGRARQYILANVIEALIGAIYLDQGYEVAQKFIDKHIDVLIDEVIENKKFIDSKSLFQEMSQEHMSITPRYDLIKESGPDHNKIFTVGVFLGDIHIASGEGKSKQEAETQAAYKGLLAKKWS
ncbi:ribonuclease III [Candidatus Parcubacteria bacterium]|nr:ribonuclease III [Candidatus Parcubacteria bacterium]